MLAGPSGPTGSKMNKALQTSYSDDTVPALQKQAMVTHVMPEQYFLMQAFDSPKAG